MHSYGKCFFFCYALYGFKKPFLFFRKKFTSGFFLSKHKKISWPVRLTIYWGNSLETENSMSSYIISKTLSIFKKNLLFYFSTKKWNRFSPSKFDSCEDRQKIAWKKSFFLNQYCSIKLMISSRSKYAIKGFSKAIWTIFFLFETNTSVSIQNFRKIESYKDWQNLLILLFLYLNEYCQSLYRFHNFQKQIF